jgi:hypothetical protein
MTDRTESESVASRIFAAIELSQSAWIVALHVPCQDKISLHRVASGDVDRLLVLFERARQTVRAASAAEPARLTRRSAAAMRLASTASGCTAGL